MITSLQFNKTKKRVNVLLDDSYSFTIDKELIAEAGLYCGKDLSKAQIKELRDIDISRRCFDVALHYLTYRPRSETEVRQQLRRRGFRHNVVNKVIVRLKKLDLVNDVSFARYWTDNRILLNPRSKRLIKNELVQKGISTEIADEVVVDLDDEVNAYLAVRKKVRILDTSDYNNFRQRLFNYLKLKGYSYETIDYVSKRLWDEESNLSE